MGGPDEVEAAAPHAGGVSLAWEALAGCVGEPTARPLTDGHGAFDNSPCAASAIDGYLAAGTLPAAGTVCAD